MPAARADHLVPGLDPRLDEVRTMVRQGRVRAGLAQLDRLAHPDDASTTRCERQDRAELVALTVECLLARGETAAASTRLPQVDDLVVGPGAARALHARADVASAQEAHERALELYLAAGAADDAAEELPWRVGASLALVRCGRRAEAVELAHAEHDRALALDDDHALARALRALATVAPDGRAVDRLEEARRRCARVGSARLAAQVDTDLAAMMVLAGDPARAVALLRSAELYAAHEELWPLQSRVRRLLERLGETPLRLESEALAVLTRAERRVAVLALDGLANRQIAVELGVSVKGVESHLSKIYRKLGVTSRGDLIATVGRHG